MELCLTAWMGKGCLICLKAKSSKVSVSWKHVDFRVQHNWIQVLVLIFVISANLFELRDDDDDDCDDDDDTNDDDKTENPKVRIKLDDSST